MPHHSSISNMDHSRDPCPWVALSDFGGAFCMGVSRLHILPKFIALLPNLFFQTPPSPQPTLIPRKVAKKTRLLGYRRCSLARCQGLQKLSLWRTTNRRSHSHQSSCACTWGEFRASLSFLALKRNYTDSPTCSGYGEAYSQHSTARSRAIGRRKILGMRVCAFFPSPQSITGGGGGCCQ